MAEILKNKGQKKSVQSDFQLDICILINCYNKLIIEEETWAKLNSLTKKIKSFEIKGETFSIGRGIENDL